ncbi:MAG: gamma-glutamyltransferase family protein, partial [Beijerinckiaceae bacterium]
MFKPLATATLLAASLFLGMAPAFAQTAAPAPEAATGRTQKTAGQAQRFMAAAANPLAATAGHDILRAGGSATDAAIAIQLVLNLVEPQSSGIGGGAFFVHWDEASKKVVTLDGREKAPMAAKPDRFMGADGKPMPFMAAVVGGRSVGVPGTLRLLETAHRRWGKLPWEQVIAPAIKLSEEGFAVSPRLHGLLTNDPALKNDALAAALYYEPDGKPRAIGYVLKNPAFAATLQAIAKEGANAFYTGTIAQDIVDTVTGHRTNPGDMTLADLASYAVVEREPVCGRYRVYRLCGMGPPSSGAVAVLQMLGVLETQDMSRLGPTHAAAHWFSEAGRLAFADRALYLGDPDFLSVPVGGLIDRNYIRSRAGLINPEKSMGRAKAGEPPNRRAQNLAPSDGVEFGTSHISV